MTWDKDVIQNMLKPKRSGSGAKSADWFHIPLALILRPDVLKELQTMMKAAKPHEVSEIVPEDAVSMMELSKNAFKDMMMGASSFLPSTSFDSSKDSKKE